VALGASVSLTAWAVTVQHEGPESLWFSKESADREAAAINAGVGFDAVYVEPMEVRE
jgi:hypothetical protein